MIRIASINDLPMILEIYAYAREFMVRTGNPNQWGKITPRKAVMEQDIQKKRLYVVEEAGKIAGCFMFEIAPDPTYAVIENGEWRSNEPYGVIHRVANGGTIKGMFTLVFEFCREQISHLRIDTHQDNKIMQHVVEKHGFIRCGTIYLENGDPRIGYEYIE